MDRKHPQNNPKKTCVDDRWTSPTFYGVRAIELPEPVLFYAYLGVVRFRA